MREVVFQLLSERPGALEAAAERPALRIAAPSLEELHHEARDALIERLGPAHGTYRVRIRRSRPHVPESPQPAGAQRPSSRSRAPFTSCIVS
ncbi:MAG: hypothetical protein VKO65_09590 [Cyanobacteriota bacterium]|nr:hypothetical protein [Cyanobacteriota bacterium]